MGCCNSEEDDKNEGNHSCGCGSNCGMKILMIAVVVILAIWYLMR